MKGNKWEVEEGKKVCYFDIDGVLNNYPICWLEYIKEQGINCGGNLNEVKHQIPYQTYKDLKWNYRESGYKEDIIPSPYASELTSRLKNQGYHICIITARPIKENPCLFGQTSRWLNKNHIQYDDLIFDADKHISVLKRYPHLQWGCEDHRYYANLIASWGYKMYLLSNEYNQGPIHSNVTRITSLVNLMSNNYLKD